MKVSGNIETILNYFIENIKEVQKNDYRVTETITLLIDLALNSIQMLSQLGDGDKKLCNFIKVMVFQALASIALDDLRAEEGENHG